MSKRAWDLLAKVGILTEVPDEKASAPASPAPTASVPVIVAATPVAAPTLSVTDPKTLELDKSLRERLVHAMDNDGAPLVEELADTIDTLKDAIPDERARYLAALKLMAKKGITSSALLGDFDKCLGVLEQNNRMFEADTAKQLEQRVGTKTRAVTDLGAQIQAKNAQLAALQQEIADLVAKQHSEQAGISGEQEKIENVKSRFALAYAAIRSEVESQRAKVAQYGQGI